MQNYEAALTLITVLQLVLYQDFGALALFFAVVPHASNLRYFEQNGMVSFFLTYAL